MTHSLSKTTIKLGILGTPSAIAKRILLWESVTNAHIHYYTISNCELQQVNQCRDISDLLQAVTAIDLLYEEDIAFDLFQIIAKAHKHVFFANPFTLSLTQLLHSAQLVKESAIKCQPGLYLRFQEDVQAHSQFLFRYIESGISLSKENTIHSNDWLALLNNHVDLLAFLARTSIKSISAFSLTINGIENALLNFRIQFDNKSVGNCTINTAALVEEQVSLLFNEEQQKHIVWSKNNSVSNVIFDQNCIISAMEHFVQSIGEDIATKVTIFDALNAVELGRDILKQIES